MAALSETIPSTGKPFLLGDMGARWEVERTESGFTIEERLGAAEKFIGDAPFGVVFTKEEDGTHTAHIRTVKGPFPVEVLPHVTQLVPNKNSLLLIAQDQYGDRSKEIHFASREVRPRLTHNYQRP